MADPNAFTARDHPHDRAARLNRLRQSVVGLGVSQAQIQIEGRPLAGQRLLRLRPDKALRIVGDRLGGDFDDAATADALFRFTLDGADIGGMTVKAGETAIAAATLTNSLVPANGLLELFSPDPRDATLSDGTVRVVLQTEE